MLGISEKIEFIVFKIRFCLFVFKISGLFPLIIDCLHKHHEILWRCDLRLNMKLTYIYFLQVYLFLKAELTEKERERERDIFHMLVQSPGDWLWARPKQGGRSFPQVSHVGRRAQSPSAFFYQAMSRETYKK